MLTLSLEDRKAFRASLIQGVRRALSGDPGITLSGQPVSQFLAGPVPGNPFSRWQHKAGRATCDRWARANRDSFLPGQDLYLRQLCTDYLGGDLPGDPETTVENPKGQCAGVQYAVTVRRNSYTRLTCSSGAISSIAVNSNTTVNIFGPIAPLRIVFDAPGNCGNTRVRAFLDGFDSSGSPLSGTVYSASVNGSTFAITNLDAEILTVVRLDGQPDNCGDPVVIFDSGEPNPTPDPNPGPVGAPVGYPFPGFDIEINPDGTIEITFGDESEPVTIDPTEGIQTGADQLEPGDIGTPSAPQTVVGGDTVEDEAPEGQVIGALQIDITSVAAGAREFAPNLWRAVAYIFMGTEDGLAIHPDGAILESGQLVLPQKDNLTHWSVTANSGYNLVATPFYI